MSTTKHQILSALLVCGLVLPLAAKAGTSAEVEKVLAEAQSSLDKAREAGNSWTTTEKLMSAARQAGNDDEAMELATRALLTADEAREQQELEQDVWQARVPAN